ncbi:D-alanyl-D-alanine carboxypeptidase-like protein [Isoptericola jiangsuensis]|uniref:D-alanyl-D-alanine carboxypeptidase-like protein n=1 Tax=Isoptericola jiangsuensis TaxID=548579 RepID=A0A2A9ERY9_9MICO|nr:M15 family metallopeptidase [Isoptericola jiangsuensis]PFG41513.1 D-alanyl-D-alanine carboxypeptidase-like protein [Isoptericola jiangsuensis]
MRHAREAAPTAPPTVTSSGPPTRSAASRGRGRHFAEPAPRRHRQGPTWSSLAPKSWPLSIGVGLAVTMATTTGLAVASGTPVPVLGDAPEGAAPVADAGTTTDTVDASRAAALLADRDGVGGGGSASRSGVRAAAPVAAAATGGVVVDADATLTTEKVRVDVEAAPEPPVLPGCDGLATGAGTNGSISSSEMCNLWDGGPAIRADAAVALARLNQAYRGVFGEDMCVTDGYRSYSQQVATKAAKGYLAATPGTSNHGWGLAVDLCPETYAGDRWTWLAAHGPDYGWDNPDWARAGGSKYEPWHWEFTAAVAVKSAY